METLMTELSSSLNSRADRRQFAKNCVEFVYDVFSFFGSLDCFIYDVETKDKYAKKESSSSFLKKFSNCFLHSTTHNSTQEKNQDDGLTPTLRKRLMKLKVDLDRLRSTAGLLQECYKTLGSSVDTEIFLRLKLNFCSDRDKDFLKRILSSDSSQFYDILIDYIYYKCSQSNSIVENLLAFNEFNDDRHLENVSLLFKEAFEKIQSCPFDPSQFINESKNTSLLQRFFSNADDAAQNKKIVEDSRLRERLYYENREDDLVDILLEKDQEELKKKCSKFCRS